MTISKYKYLLTILLFSCFSILVGTSQERPEIKILDFKEVRNFHVDYAKEFAFQEDNVDSTIWALLIVETNDPNIRIISSESNPGHYVWTRLRENPRFDINESRMPNEIWYSLRAGAQKFRVVHSLYRHDSDIPVLYNRDGSHIGRIESNWYIPVAKMLGEYGLVENGKTYRMIIDVPSSYLPPVEDKAQEMGWIVIDSKPQGAKVFSIKNGVETLLDKPTPYQERVPYGTYFYRISKNLYHDEEISINLNKEKVDTTITLRANFGSINITSTPPGAEVSLSYPLSQTYTTPCRIDNIPSGTYTLTLMKASHTPYEQTITVTGGEVTQVNASLDSRLAQVTINSLPGATIMINGETKATTSYTGQLKDGIYDIEATLAGHEKATKQITVVAKQPQTIELNPTPIYGTLSIMSTPHNAAVTVDGEIVGTTPLTLDKLLVGTHTVKINLEGHEEISKVVEIKKDIDDLIDVRLNKASVLHISKAEFANTDAKDNIINDYGTTLYSKDMRYLNCNLHYNGVSTKITKTLYIKIYKPDGTLSSGKNSPEGYTRKREVIFHTGNNNILNIGGWGNSTESTYKPGTYTYEIWSEGKKIYTAYPYISSSDNIHRDTGLKITKAEFGNIDYDGNILNNYGSTLKSYDMRYLKCKLHYSGLSASTTKTIFIKIFDPDGNLDTGSSSPEGYTTKDEITFKPGSNTVTITGWGNKKSSSYPAGTYRYEIWIDGQKAYTAYPYISPDNTDFSRFLITKAEFANTDINGNILDNYGAALKSYDMRYLKCKLHYKGLTSSTTKAVYIKIFDPDGNLEHSSSSPKGYTTKDDVSFSPGSNTISIAGWGNSIKSSYPAGTYRYEIWIDGQNVHTAYPQISSDNTDFSRFKISKAEFGNIDYDGNVLNNYGSTLISADMKYLECKLHYSGLSSNITKAVYIKLYDPDGTLRTGDSSPDGYTTKSDVTFKPGANTVTLGSWGNSNSSSYPTGTYRYEIWIDKEKVYTAYPYISSGNTDFSRFRITKAEFANVDYDGNTLNYYGSALTADNMKYLKCKLHYSGLSSSITKTVYTKIYEPDGTLKTGNTSPEGYSTKNTVTFKPGANTVYLQGWGNNNKSIYTAGTYRYEIWIDGQKMYTAYCEIKSSQVAKNAEITKVWADHNVYEYGEKGMMIHINCSIQDAKDHECEIAVYFYDENKNGLIDFDNSHYTSAGKVATNIKRTPFYDKTTYTDLKIFMPYKQLHVNTNGTKKTYYYSITIHDNKTKEAIATSGYYGFTYSN